jgi:fumarate hydratase class I
MVVITGQEFITSLTAAVQFISHTHPKDFVAYLHQAYLNEQNAAAKSAIRQILINSRMSMLGRRPICQDTGVVNVMLKVGMDVRWDTDLPPEEMVNLAVAKAYCDEVNPLRASMVMDPIGRRLNTQNNTPAMTHIELVPGASVEVHVVAKGGGSENKTKFEVLLPGGNIADWVVRQVEHMGAGWCPPGVLGIGVGGTVERSMLLAKMALLDPLDMQQLQMSGATTAEDELRLEIFERVNALGIGAQGIGGTTTVLDVKVKSSPTHAASMPVSLIPNCAANRHISFKLDGTGAPEFDPPDPSDWPDIVEDEIAKTIRSVNLNTLTREEIGSWKFGDQFLLNGTLITGRDAAHRRLCEMIDAGQELPVNLDGKMIYYVGPVDPVGDEVVGPAGPTTATRMDPFTETMLRETGLMGMIGKAERGPAAIEAIKKHKAISLVAVGGAAFLISKSIRFSKIIAFADLGMEAMREFEVVDMPVTVGVDARGKSLHVEGPRLWASPITHAD